MENNEKNEKKSVVRYEKNPFLEDMSVPVKGQRVRISRLGEQDQVLLNQVTGEIQGTHITTYKKVDSDQFIKIFTANISLTFELKASGIKAFNVLLWILQQKTIDKDLVPLDKFTLEGFLNYQDKKLSLSLATFGRGLADLEKSKIIAKHVRQGWYFINPNFVFNGDRVAFTTIIERNKSADKPKIESGEKDG